MSLNARFIWPVVACLTLAGCHGWQQKKMVLPHPQDSFQTRGNVAAKSMPDALPLTRLPDIDGRADSPAAYRAPAMPSFADRPLQENVEASIELADYAQVLRQAGVMPWLNGNGPYTVFAVPNAALERFAAQTGGSVSSSYTQALLASIARYTVVQGHWDEAALSKAMQRSRHTTIALKALSGQWLYVQAVPEGGFSVGNGRDPAVRLWGTSFPQSNGVLYFLRDVVAPAQR
ncbi:fasciclin domain-containing protein [Neokomagataea thailandica]|nr:MULTISPECIES: fasciclin domain-containing protein [Neokomagataea]